MQTIVCFVSSATAAENRTVHMNANRVCLMSLQCVCVSRSTRRTKETSCPSHPREPLLTFCSPTLSCISSSWTSLVERIALICGIPLMEGVCVIQFYIIYYEHQWSQSSPKVLCGLTKVFLEGGSMVTINSPIKRDMLYVIDICLFVNIYVDLWRAWLYSTTMTLHNHVQ